MIHFESTGIPMKLSQNIQVSIVKQDTEYLKTDSFENISEALARVDSSNALANDVSIVLGQISPEITPCG